MMTNKPLLVLLATAVTLLLTGCSSVNLQTDYALDKDFGHYQRYAWHPRESEPSAALDTFGGDIFDKRVRKIIAETLNERKLTEASTDTADFLINYTVITEERVSVNTYNSYGGYGPGWGHHRHGWGHNAVETSVYYYTQGTLIIDVVDAKTNKLTWRSTADGRVDQSATPQKREENLRKTITRMLKDFPPS